MDNSSPEEPPVEIVTGPNPAMSIIWLHGLGADGHDFEGLIPELPLAVPPARRFVFPHAPYRPVTINGGHVMRAWYDIAMTERGFEQNVEHIRASQKILIGLIENENKRGISSEQIVLAGFSQGGAIALHTGLRYPRPLAGILSLSAPVPFVDDLMTEIHPANATIPIFMGHGTEDSMIPLVMVEHAVRLMKSNGLALEWHTYATGHALTPEEMTDFSQWLGSVIGLR